MVDLDDKSLDIQFFVAAEAFVVAQCLLSDLEKQLEDNFK
jgi:hypothetical protein